MTLNQNLKKYFAIKAIDTGALLLFAALLFVSFAYARLQLVMWLDIIISFVIYAWLNHYTGKRIDKWVVPEMTRVEEKQYHLTDTWFWVVLLIAVGLVIRNIIDIWLYVILAIIILAIKEIKKWRAFNKGG